MLRGKLSTLLTALLVAGVSLTTARSAGATAIALSELTFSNLQIAPSAGAVILLDPWELEAFAQAQNSLGEVDANFDSATGPAAVSAAVTYADAQGSAEALGVPPDLDVTADADSSAQIPGMIDAQAVGLGQSTLFNLFMLTGGTGSVPVDFSVDITGSLDVFTDAFGVLAEAETAFNLEVDGIPVLFSQSILSIGPNDAGSLAFADTLTESLTLDYDTPYFLLAAADSETEAINTAVPEPGTVVLVLVGLGLLAARLRHWT